MTMVTTADVDAIVTAAELTAAQESSFRSSVASWAMEGKAPTLEEMQVGAELAAGRIDFAAARAQLGVAGHRVVDRQRA